MRTTHPGCGAEMVRGLAQGGGVAGVDGHQVVALFLAQGIGVADDGCD